MQCKQYASPEKARRQGNEEVVAEAVEVAGLHQPHEVVEPLLAGTRPERRILELGLVAERVEADSPALLEDPLVVGLAVVRPVVGMAEQDTIERQPLLAEDLDGRLGVDAAIEGLLTRPLKAEE